MNDAQRECPQRHIQGDTWMGVSLILPTLKQSDFCTRRKQRSLKIQGPPAEAFLQYERLVQGPQSGPTMRSMEVSRPEHWSGQPFPPPGIFPTQESNRGLLHCRQVLYQLSYECFPFSLSPGCVSNECIRNAFTNLLDSLY